MVAVTFRTLGPWGSGKGSNLMPSEVDNNFWSLAQAIVALQDNPALPNGIANIAVSGTQMTITLSDGSVMGPFTLPMLAFRWRGDWLPSTVYALLDVFKVDNVGIFLVQGDTYVSGTTFDDTVTDGSGNPLLWQLFGSTDASLSGLSDVQIDGVLHDGDFLYWVAADNKWENVALGDMAFQLSNNVDIIGGTITGLASPTNSADAATKGYVDTIVTAGSTPIPAYTLVCNINGFSTTAAPHLLSDFLDAAFGSTVVGNIIYRSGAGWQVLPPGAAGTILQSNGAGVAVAWTASPGTGVTSITAGTGISTGGAPITTTGIISLATIPDGDLQANITGTTNAPAPVTLSAYLDHVLGASRGTVLTRTIAGWVALAPGTSGLYLKTQGSGADLMWDAPPGSGTVLSVGTGTGLTGGPITSTGTILLASIPTGDVLANISGSTAAPTGVAWSLLIDNVAGSTQGDILYRGASTWTALAPGTSGQILTTGGAAANPSWQNAPVTGGSINNLQIVSNILGHTAVPVGNTLSALFDAILSSSRGSIIYRTNSGWVALAPGTAGQVLTTNGGTADPTWNTNGGALLNIASPAAQDMLSYNPSSGRFENVRPRYHLGAYVPSTMAASQNLLFHRFSKAITIPANFGAYLGHTSQAAGMTAATASTVVTIQRALSGTPTTWANVASITFAAGAVLGTFSTQAAINFAQGDLIRLRGPATPDVTFSDFTATIMGYET